MTASKTTGATNSPLFLLKLKHDLHRKSWSSVGKLAGNIVTAALLGCILYGTFKLLNMQLVHSKRYNERSSHSSVTTEGPAWTSSCPSNLERTTAFISRNFWGQLGKLFIISNPDHKHPGNEVGLHNSWPSDDMLALPAEAGTIVNKRQMALEEAEGLVKHWQDIKAEALGPNYQIQMLPDILAESMLSKWLDLANSAKARACFWRFVLLKLTVLRSEIISDGVGGEMAEIEAVLEEAAELVDETEPKKPSYYSTYKVQYILKRQADGSWRFCIGGIQNHE